MRGVLLVSLLVVYCQSILALDNPILFVTQIPISADFTTIASVFGNHRADLNSVGRGGDLYTSNTATALVQIVRYGPASSSWLALTGDWNGDGVTTIGLYDPANGLFRLRNNNSSGAAHLRFAPTLPATSATPLSGRW